MQSLKESHEEEVQKLIFETKHKLSQYQSKVGKEMEMRQRVQSLEHSLSENEAHRQEAMEDFTAFKRKAGERESVLKADHSQSVLSLSQDLLAVKRDFEDRLRQFEDIKHRLENERINQIAEIRTKQASELSDLQQKLKAAQSGVTQEKEQLIAQYNAQINKLHEQCEELNNEKNHMSDDYEAKLSKSQAFYERELAALKDEIRLNAANDWKDQESALKKQFGDKERGYQKKVDDLAAQLAVCEEDLSDYKDKLRIAESNLSNKDSSSDALGKQVCIFFFCLFVFVW